MIENIEPEVEETEEPIDPDDLLPPDGGDQDPVGDDDEPIEEEDTGE